MIGASSELAETCDQLMAAGIDVSLFIDPDSATIEASSRLDVHAIELHTGDYAEAQDEEERSAELKRLQDAATYAAGCSLMVAAGHGLDYVNTPEIAAIPEVEELNIGHSIVARSIFVGFDQAVREMLALMRQA